MRNKPHETRLGRPATGHAAPPVRGIRPAVFYAVFATLFATNFIALLALLMTPEISTLVNGRTAATLAAYQDRIAQLRLEVDRLHSRQYAQTGDINLQLQELAQQQEVLTEQHQYVKALADKAAELGIGPVATAPAPVAAPTPAATPLRSSDAGAAAIEEAGHKMREMMDESRTVLTAISSRATISADQILTSLRQVGITPDMPADAEDADAAMGGPLLPPRDGTEDDSLVDEANAVVAALARFKTARDAAAEAPVHLPIAGSRRISSGFGNRTDPFTGRQAFHPGLDYPWPTGTPVTAAGDGKVIYVGQINGYGNVVDIDHGGGIVTRYGHLSSFIARQGQMVHTGTPIARVGSTGRSTGPHLHFEVRRNNTPVNPNIYLAIGKRLAQFLAPTRTARTSTDDLLPAGNSGNDSDSDGVS